MTVDNSRAFLNYDARFDPPDEVYDDSDEYPQVIDGIRFPETDPYGNNSEYLIIQKDDGIWFDFAFSEDNQYVLIHSVIDSGTGHFIEDFQKEVVPVENAIAEAQHQIDLAWDWCSENQLHRASGKRSMKQFIKDLQAKLDEIATVCVIRRFKGGNELIALFPEEPTDLHGHMCNSYMHVGQHGSASPWIVGGDTLPVDYKNQADDVKDLIRELEGIGYRLKLYRRITPAMREKREAQAKAWRTQVGTPAEEEAKEEAND